MVVESALGGTGEVTRTLITRLQSDGHRVGLIYSERRIDPKFRSWLLATDERGVARWGSALHPFRGPLGLIRSARLIRRISSDYDVIHLHGAWAGLLGRLSLRKTKKPIVYSPHGGVFHPRKGRLYRWGQKLEGVLARNTSAIVVSSAYERDRVAAIVGAKAPVALIEHGLDAGAPTTNHSADTSIRFGVVGRLVAEKRVDLAVSALARAVQRVASIRLVLVGEGPSQDEIMALARQLKVSGSIDPLGFVTERSEIYGAFDVLLLPSDSEAAPLVVPEAQAYGVPAIVTASGGGVVSIDPGVNGLIVPRGDAAALAQAMVDIATSADLRTQLSRGAAATASTHRSWEAATGDYVDLYRGLAG